MRKCCHARNAKHAPLGSSPNIGRLKTSLTCVVFLAAAISSITMHRRCLPLALATLLLVSCAVDGCVVDTMKDYPELEPLLKALEAANLADALNSQDNTITLFAPTAVAFQKLSLVTGLNASDILSNIVGLNTAMAYHLLSGLYTSDMLKQGVELPTLLPNGTIVVNVIGDGEFAPGTYITSDFGTPARITTPNIKSPDCDSIFHIVDEFLLANATGPALGISWA